jgi:hypothetical protein
MQAPKDGKKNISSMRFFLFVFNMVGLLLVLAATVALHYLLEVPNAANLRLGESLALFLSGCGCAFCIQRIIRDLRQR